jgi:Flp pilus assembly protein TadG
MGEKKTIMSANKHCDQNKYRSAPAQSLVEVVLLIPLLLILIMGAVDFGRVFMTKFILTNAAREGAHYLAYNPNSIANSYQVIKNEASSSGVTVSDGEISILGCCTLGSPATVTVSKTMDLIFDGFLDAVGIIDGPISISSAVQMVVLVE